MGGTFQSFDQFLNVVVAKSLRQSQRPGTNNKLLSFWFPSSHKPQTEKMINSCLQRSTGAPNLPPQQLSYVLINGKRGSHITMFAR